MMRRRRFLAIASLLPVGAIAAQDESLSARVRQASRDGDFAQPAPAELDAAQALFLRLLKGDAVAAAEWNAIDLQADLLPDGGVAVSELPTRKSGRGFHVVRPRGVAVMLQAPHSFKDKHTREIALGLVESGAFRAAAWNTVPRHYQRGGARVDADLAHLPHTHLVAFSLAFARAFPAGRVVQLHGFEQEKRHTRAGRDADIILSAAMSPAPAHLLRLEACIERALAVQVVVYPRDVRELGAITNSVGRALHGIGFEGFVHIEMSHALRERLREDRAALDGLRACLEALG